MRRTTQLLVCTLAGGLLSWSQTASPVDANQEFRLVSEVRLVVLDVGVRDRQGRPVAGLQREAFRVVDSGRQQTVTSFAAEDAPVTLGLVIDASRSMRSQRGETIQATSALIAESRAEDEVFLVTFNDEVAVQPPAAPDELGRRISATPLEGQTALYDGIDAALTQLQSGTWERKVLVVVSDGEDTASRLDRGEVMRRVHLSHATIYTIGLTGEPAVPANPGFLRELARTSGGDAYVDVPPSELTRVCQDIAREIRSRYMLAFHAAETAKPQTRKLRVTVEGPADRGPFRVFSRREYIALPTASEGGSPRP